MPECVSTPCLGSTVCRILSDSAGTVARALQDLFRMFEEEREAESSIKYSCRQRDLQMLE